MSLAHVLLGTQTMFWVWSGVVCFIGFCAGVMFGLRAARIGQEEVVPDPIPRGRIMFIRPDPDPDDILTSVDATAGIRARRAP